MMSFHYKKWNSASLHKIALACTLQGNEVIGQQNLKYCKNKYGTRHCWMRISYNCMPIPRNGKSSAINYY